MAKRVYKGSELSSPTYRKVAAKMAKNKNVDKEYQPYKRKINGK